MFYTGVTNNLLRRVEEHKQGKSKFTAKYKITKLVYYEQTIYMNNAFEREKQVKAGSRIKKIQLINDLNESRKDLYPELVS